MTDLMSAIQRKRLEAVYGDEPFDDECAQFQPASRALDGWLGDDSFWNDPPSVEVDVDESYEQANLDYRQLAD